MKKSLFLFIAFASLGITLIAQVEKNVIAGPGYVNDVYYSLEEGVVDTVPMKNWDIAFTTEVFSAGILANTGAGTELYTYPLGTIDDWATLDTTGMTWNMMFNSMDSWEEGAFSYNATGHPDYGWGVYGGMGLLTGDSIFVLKTTGGAYKKLVIISKTYSDPPLTNIWEFKYADLDGSNEQTVTLPTADYTDKNFVYYSLDSMEVVDREPVTTGWDLLFTKYTDYVNYDPYFHVTGVLTNEDHVMALEVREPGLDQSSWVSFEEDSFAYDMGVIGGDWKEFDFSTGYVLNDTVVYFIKDYSDWDPEGETYLDSTYYKIYFTGFTGMSQGKYTFMQEELIAVSQGNPDPVIMLEVYPNPASEYLNLVLDHSGRTSISVFDIAGRRVHSTSRNTGGLTSIRLDLSDLYPGLFFIKVDTGNGTIVTSFIKE